MIILILMTLMIVATINDIDISLYKRKEKKNTHPNQVLYKKKKKHPNEVKHNANLTGKTIKDKPKEKRKPHKNENNKEHNNKR